MNEVTQTIKRLVVGIVLALSLTSTLYGQVPPPPDPGTNAPLTEEQIAAARAAWLAALSNNLASVSGWLHDGYALADGTPADFQTIMDQQATDFSANAANMATAQQSALEAAWTWAINTGVPPMMTNADGFTIAFLMDIEDGVPLYNVGLAVEAAQTIATDKTWPGGSTGYNLNGTNRTISMWEQGSPRLTHIEFAPSRITELDGNTTIDNHSTAVAGVLAGGGYYDVYIGTPPNNLTNIGRAGKGMSFAANVQAWDFIKDTSEMAGSLGTNHMRLSNHSYGRTTGWYQDINLVWYWLGNSEISTDQDPKFGLYSATSSNIDQIIQNAPTYASVWAAGNSVSNGPPVQPTNHVEYTLQLQGYITNTVHPRDGYLGGYDTLSEQASCKNVVTVGAVLPLTNGYGGTNSVTWAPFSSCGPTDDGRIKPDVVAAGVGILTTAGVGDNYYYVPPGIPGTSFSAPGVAGSINLLAQCYQQLHTNSAELLASTLKGLVIHTADQCGGAAGPSYRFGWGLMDTARAATLTQQDATNGLKNQIKEVMLNNGQYVQFPVISPGGSSNPLKLTICWTDPAGSANAETNLNNPAIKLVNDLDLRVIAPSGTTNLPYVLNPDLTNQSPSVRASAATTGDNTRDNVEQVYIASPASGSYIVKVTHKGTLTNSQWVSILISGNTAQQPPALRINQILQTATNQMAVGWPAVVGQRYQVQTVSVLSASNNWQNIGPQVSARLTDTFTQFQMSGAKAFYRVAQVP